MSAKSEITIQILIFTSVLAGKCNALIARVRMLLVYLHLVKHIMVDRYTIVSHPPCRFPISSDRKMNLWVWPCWIEFMHWNRGGNKTENINIPKCDIFFYFKDNFDTFLFWYFAILDSWRKQRKNEIYRSARRFSRRKKSSSEETHLAKHRERHIKNLTRWTFRFKDVSLIVNWAWNRIPLFSTSWIAVGQSSTYWCRQKANPGEIEILASFPKRKID